MLNLKIRSNLAFHRIPHYKQPISSGGGGSSSSSTNNGSISIVFDRHIILTT